MGELKIDSAEASDLDNAITDFSVDPKDTDGPGESGESKYTQTKWRDYYGYYKSIPELRAIIDAKATWTIGKGFEANSQTQFRLDSLEGFGKDSFNTILENMSRTMQIAGDAYAEIIRDKNNNLINLKPLNPGRMTIVINTKGIITRYDYLGAEKGAKPQPFTPEKIFHLSRNRTADEMHGTSLVETLEWIILAKNEIQSIVKKIMQRHLKPVMIFHLDTDNVDEIAAFKAKNDKAFADGENIYIPKDVVVPEVLAVSPNATLNPMAWLEYLNTQFYQTGGVPQIIVGGSSEFVEKATSIVYLAYQQNVEEDQLYIEEQIGKQLGQTIDLVFPVSLENELLSDEKKDGATNIDPSQTAVGEQQ